MKSLEESQLASRTRRLARPLFKARELSIVCDPSAATAQECSEKFAGTPSIARPAAFRFIIWSSASAVPRSALWRDSEGRSAMWGLCMLACQRLEVQAGQLSGCNNSGGLAGCQGGQPRQHFCFHTALRSSRLLRTQRCTSGVRTSALRQRTHRRGTVGTYPVPETEKERSPVDYPQVVPSLWLVWFLGDLTVICSFEEAAAA